MPSRLVFPSLIVLTALLAGCAGVSVYTGQAIQGSGSLAEETRPVSVVTAVQLSMPGTLHIEIGSPESLRISAEDNVLPYIETESRGGELDIRTQPGVDLRTVKPIDFYLTVPSLDKIRVTSSGSAEAPDLSTSHFTASISSSGSITIASLQAETLKVEISSSGSLTILGGTIDSQDIRISSSGGYDARTLQSRQASVRLSSSGSAWIRVAESLEGNLTSSGSVHYLGSPEVSVTRSSSGEAIPITE